MKVKDIAKIIEDIAPLSLTEEWDNVGLMVGNFEDSVKGVVVSVDLTNGAINEAIKNNCNLIITHHPAIFEPLKSFNCDNYTAGLISKCIQNNINVYSAHTNMDMSNKGINFEFARKLNVKVKSFLNDGLGVYGDFCGNLDKLLLKIKEITNEKNPKLYMGSVVKDTCKSNNNEEININLIHENQKIAFISGSGGRIEEVISKCKELGITTFISSEFKHNILLELLASNVNVVELGHFESEVIFTEIIYNLLKDKISNLYKYVNLI